MSDVIEPIYTRRDGFLHVAVIRHKLRERESSVICMGKFPENCPKIAIREWLERVTRNSDPASALVLSTG